MIVILTYIVAVAVAEILGVYLNVVVGVIAELILIIMLVLHCSYRGSLPYQRVLTVLLLAPLLRILSVMLPIPQIPKIYWYVLAGTPLLIAAALTVRLLGLRNSQLGLEVRFKAPQAVIALSGLPLSVAGFLILRPEALFKGFNWPAILISSIILLLFAGFAEEFLFRGLFFRVASEAFGATAAVICSSLLFATMYIGSLSLGYLGFMGIVGLFFGYCVNRTGSIWGTIVAHSVMTIGQIVIWPAVVASLR
jgi:membrane protease YdiL (CAAX protease family)